MASKRFEIDTAIPQYHAVIDTNKVVFGFKERVKGGDKKRKIDWAITCIEQKLCGIDATDTWVDIFVFLELKTPMDERNGFIYEERSLRSFLETKYGSRFKGEGWKYELLDTFAVDAEGLRQ
jgi:hypothetical protein